MSERRAFDYIIIGAGSAGLVLANRLSANPKVSVCVIEVGRKDRNPLIHIPFGLAILARLKGINWNYDTVPQTHLNNRKLFWPRGKVMGGSSSVNAMCYIRGAAENYDEWAAMGASGWDWKSVLPLFKKSEGNVRGPSEFHGAGGPLSVSDNPDVNPLSHVFVEAGRQVQLPETVDFNGENQLGVGLYQTTTRKGRRGSTAATFFAEVSARPNLTTLTSTQVRRIVFDGKRAVGVEIADGAGTTTITASQEILLCVGAINSPQLLMLSGVGSAAHLKEHSISQILDLPGVGENLQDHPDIIVQVAAKTRDSYAIAPWAMLKMGAELPKYLIKGRGGFASNVAEAGGFARSNLAGQLPDIQWHFLPARIENHGRTTAFGYGYALHACNLYPESRGTIRLASSNPNDAPLIDPNYLSTERDMDMMLEAFRLSRQILNAPAFDVHRKKEIEPGADVTSRDDIIQFIRNKTESVYHPVGTCKMGAIDDESAVVGPDLKVCGLTGLRVVDASVMPRLVGGNTNAPTIMIAEKAAEMILENA